MRALAFTLVIALCGCEPAILVSRIAQDGAMEGGEDVPDGATPQCAMPFTATRIALGEAHACALHDGHVFCWGHGLSGQTGNGSTDAQYEPDQISNDTFDAITAMTLGACARRTSDDMLLCWGENFAGGLANGGMQASATPVPTITGVVSMAGGQSNMLTTNDAGLLTVWGDNTYGHLGLDPAMTGDAIRTETAVPGSVFKYAAGGAHHNCVMDGAQRVYCAGENQDGQLGTGTGTVHTFTLVNTLETFMDFDAGANRTCGVAADLGKLFCWGKNYDPVVIPGEDPELAEPTQVGTLTGYTQVSVGFATICALRDGGRLYCWGAGMHDALGFGDSLAREMPTEMTPGVTYKEVSVGRYFACAIRASDNGVVCFGRNDDAQLARPMGDTSTEPRVICLD